MDGRTDEVKKAKRSGRRKRREGEERLLCEQGLDLIVDPTQQRFFFHFSNYAD